MRNILLPSWRTNLALLLLQLVIYAINYQLGRLCNGMEPHGIVFLVVFPPSSQSWSHRGGVLMLEDMHCCRLWGVKEGKKEGRGILIVLLGSRVIIQLSAIVPNCSLSCWEPTMSEDILRLQSGQDTFPSNVLSPWNLMNKHNLPTVITWFCFQAWLTLMDFKGCY